MNDNQPVWKYLAAGIALGMVALTAVIAISRWAAPLFMVLAVAGAVWLWAK
jgi:hypothetical protein